MHIQAKLNYYRNNTANEKYGKLYKTETLDQVQSQWNTLTDATKDV